MKQKAVILLIILVLFTLTGSSYKQATDIGSTVPEDIVKLPEEDERDFAVDIPEENTTQEVLEEEPTSTPAPEQNTSLNPPLQSETIVNNNYAPSPNQTVKNMLVAAMEPVGRCLYVWGGAWNEADTGAGIEAMTIGVSQRWYQFFSENGSDYDYNKTRYQIHDGLDCSGFVGYVTYQIFENRYSNTGYVFKSGTIPSKYKQLFGGQYTESSKITDYRPCDVMGTNGHVYMVVGSCGDGSVLFVHASPPVVTLCGTPTPSGVTESEAVMLARTYMSKYRSESYSRFDTCSKGMSFLTSYNQFRWDINVLSDPDGYRNMSAEEILNDLFP